MTTQPQGASVPLPQRPDLRHLKDEAKTLFKAGGAKSIADAQFQIAKRYGFPSWPKLKAHVEAVAVIPVLVKAIVAGDLQYVRDCVNTHPK